MPKPTTTVPDQIALLKKRGLAGVGVDPGSDEYRQLMHWLMNNGYYRLSGYWRYHQKDPRNGENWFIGGSVAEVQAAYDFDAGLRSYLSEGLAVLEVTFRSRLAYYVATALGPLAYLEEDTYIDLKDKKNGNVLRDGLLDDIDRQLADSKERFIQHHVRAGEPIPIWAAMEAVSFGTVSKMYSLLADAKIRADVAKTFGISSYAQMRSIVRSFVTLRNTCAHHGRIWNRVPDIPCPVLNPLKAKGDSSIYNQTPWGWIVMLCHLVDQIQKNDRFSQDLNGFLDQHHELLVGLKYPKNH
ncbi:Abi family protein [Rhodococcus sp. IITD102]|uniref:Abi family protein n=1 Tax=Rhodococcus TaxID=1827 RepID=UPI0026F445B3|nr:Abi family protein [Rhodococcus ruber]MDO2379824.1 Abi family protein [Rhodococcus ruber]